MLKTLRKKFILINMLLVFLVLAVVFSAFCVSGYRRSQEESRMALQMALGRRDGHRSPMFEVGQKPPEGFARAPVFVLQVDQNGTVSLLLADNVSVTEDSLHKIAGAVLSGGLTEGILRDYNLRFMQRDERGNTKIAFIEISNELAAVNSMVLLSSFAMAAALLAFFGISLFLSGWALRPAEQAWRRQRQFVADASHELKTPLTVILANVGILKAKRSDTIEKQINWVENTEAEAGRMKKLVDDLLFLAKSDDAKAPVVHTKINLSDLALSSALAFEAVAFDKGISLDVSELAPDLHVSGDESQLRQVMSILLDNAVKYSDDSGAVTVALDIRQAKAVFSVHNGGAPLSPEDIGHLFDRFYRADKARPGEGYGLGLAIAKSIVELHHGKITVESGVNTGTAFTLILPLY